MGTRNLDDYYTARQAAEKLGITRQGVHILIDTKWKHSGVIWIGNLQLIPKVIVDDHKPRRRK